MESLTIDDLPGIILVIVGPIFILWLAPQAVGGKPFFLDLEEQDWYKNLSGKYKNKACEHKKTFNSYTSFDIDYH